MAILQRAVMAAVAWAMLGPVCVPAQAVECGPPDAPCAVDGGTYNIVLPDPLPEGPLPVFVYLHGFAATGPGAAGHKPLVDPVLARGYAFLAPSGQPETLSNQGLDWGVHDDFDWARDDHAFLAAVLDDAVARFGLDRDRVLLAGYSRGGSMVWDVACTTPGYAAGYAAISGGFWEPMWESCAGPVHLFHMHGWTDRTVPVEGKEGDWFGQHYRMGSIWKGMALWQQTDGCGKAADAAMAGDVWAKRWTGCAAGSLTLALHPGNHSRPADWPGRVLDWFEATVPRQP